MKNVTLICYLVVVISCNQQSKENRRLQEQIDSLQHKLNESYRPGFGEFMSSIQVHHAKLWFAGSNNNWALAKFEMDEILESLEDIKQYNTDRPESKSIDLIFPAIDSLNDAIRQKNQQLFKSSYTVLTNSCNNCHRLTDHAFNVVTIPSVPPVTNQRFERE